MPFTRESATTADKDLTLTRAEGAQPGLDLTPFSRWFGNLADRQPHSRIWRHAWSLVALTYALGVGLAGLRLLIAWFVLSRLRRRSRPLTEPDLKEAIEQLHTTNPYDMSLGAFTPADPVYVRGQAYLMLRNGSAAASEFQKIIEHPGIMGAKPVAVAAHLGLARAYTLQGDTAKARAAYQDFLTLWKDADPDIPILQQAKAEYAKLQ